VPVAYDVAQALGAPLDIFVVRKLGVPGREAVAMVAIGSGDVLVLNDDVIRWYGITPAMVDAAAAEEQMELERREQSYRDGRAPLPVEDKVVVIVDDGLATGSTMRAAIEAVRQKHPARVIVAVPVGARDTVEQLARLADEVVCAFTPEPFTAVGQWYRNFEQTTDEEVRELLRAGTGVATPRSS